MKTFSLKFLFIVTAIFFSVSWASAQIPGMYNREEPLPDSIKERLHKLKIEEEKKDHETLLKRSEEVAFLSKEIQSSYAKNKALTSKDQKKLARVEKLLKKIRRELRAGKDNGKIEEKEKPKSLDAAISILQENTLKLYDEVKKTTRHSISVVAIQSSNAVWKLVKFIRFKK